MKIVWDGHRILELGSANQPPKVFCDLHGTDCCCTAAQCFRKCKLCTCDHGDVPSIVYVHCNEVSDGTEIIRADNGHCYEVLAGTYPVLPAGAVQASAIARYTSCSECCVPPPCWRVLTKCSCQTGSHPQTVYVLCQFISNAMHFVSVTNGGCYSVGGTINYPPAGAVATYIAGVYESCIDCCAPPPCPTNCAPCPTSYTLIVPASHLTAGSCYTDLSQATVHLSNVGGACIWNGCGVTPNGYVFACPPDILPAEDNSTFGSLFCSQGFWTIEVDYGVVCPSQPGQGTRLGLYQYSSPGGSCAPGGQYVQLPGSGPPGSPGAVSLT